MKISGLLAIGFGSYPYNKLLNKANIILAAMKKNVATFPSPVPTMIALAALIAAYIASRDRGVSSAQKKTAKKELVEALQQLSVYVEGIALGDPLILDLSGFDLKKVPARNQSQLETPAGFGALITLVQGTIRLHCKPVPFAQHYEVTYYPTLAGSPSITVTFDRIDEMVIENLTHALDYTFVIRAKGAVGYGGFSQKITLLAN